jgi:hypothetical protein
MLRGSGGEWQEISIEDQKEDPNLVPTFLGETRRTSTDFAPSFSAEVRRTFRKVRRDSTCLRVALDVY